VIACPFLRSDQRRKYPHSTLHTDLDMVEGIPCMRTDHTLTAADSPTETVEALDCRSSILAKGTGHTWLIFSAFESEKFVQERIHLWHKHAERIILYLRQKI
jgi:hypothetical protein